MKHETLLLLLLVIVALDILMLYITCMFVIVGILGDYGSM